MIQDFVDVMNRGGWVMWPLLGLSVVGLTLVVERAWFWARLNRPGALRTVALMGRLLRQRDLKGASELAHLHGDVYGDVVTQLLAEKHSPALVTEVVESQRRRLERFMPTLSTIITAAPMLGILGTVFGIIASFDLLSAQGMATDPKQVGVGIAEALITTAAGLLVALGVLFPYNAFRAQIEWTLGRIESLAASVQDPAPPPTV